MQVKNQWENAKLIMLNNDTTTVADFFIPSQTKQKLFLLVVGWRHVVINVIDMEFSRTFYKYSI